MKIFQITRRMLNLNAKKTERFPKEGFQTERVGVLKSLARLPPLQRLSVVLSFTGVGLVGLWLIGDVEEERPFS